MTNEERVRQVGGQRLVDYYDAILEAQRRRWQAPDWRHQPWVGADFQNAADTAAALDSLFGQ